MEESSQILKFYNLQRNDLYRMMQHNRFLAITLS